MIINKINITINTKLDSCIFNNIIKKLYYFKRKKISTLNKEHNGYTR